MKKAFSRFPILLGRSCHVGKILTLLCVVCVLGVVYCSALFTSDIKLPLLPLPLCPKTPPGLKGSITPSLAVLADEHIAAANPEVQPGGYYQPRNCTARSRTGIIVAYRDRAEHLQMFLNNLHPVLQRQQLDYTIFIVEQAGKDVFNKGVLFNAGYTEAIAAGSVQCVVFHDVDVYPEDDRNSYHCRSVPTLLVAAMSKFHYAPLYQDYFGAAVSFSTQHFAEINGYPNMYWGWGGEDDDIGGRVRREFGNFTVTPLATGRYTMVSHGHDEGNPINDERFNLVNTAHERYDTDGLVSLNYTLITTERRPLYTWLLVDVGQPPPSVNSLVRRAVVD